MKTHSLKIKKKDYRQLIDSNDDSFLLRVFGGKKKTKKDFVIEVEDDNYKVGDYIRMEEWKGRSYTGRVYIAKIKEIIDTEGNKFLVIR